MVIYGAGDHGRVIYAGLKAEGIKVVGFFDDNYSLKSLMDLPVHLYSKDVYPGSKIIVAIGNNLSRKTVAAKIAHSFSNAFGPNAHISQEAAVGVGSMVLTGAVIQSYATVGEHVIVNTGAVIDHDCRIGDFVHIAPNCTLCGKVSVGELSFIGAGSVILPGIKIGRNCVVGAGSVVLRDVDNHAVVAGNPARIIKS